MNSTILNSKYYPHRSEYLKSIGFSISPDSENLCNKLKIVCNKCNTEIRRSWHSITTENIISCKHCERAFRVKYIEENGYTIHPDNTEYSHKIRTICNICKNERTIHWNEFYNKNQINCPHCKTIFRAKFVEYNGYTLLSSDKNLGGSMKLVCSKCNNIKRTTWERFYEKKLTSCRECERKERETFIVNKGYYIYPNCDVMSGDLKLKCCNCNEIRKTTWSKFHLRGDILCPYCMSRSNFETSVEQELKNLNLEFQVNTRKIISPYELDFYISKYNLAIECNGDYWHSIEHNEKWKGNKFRHLDKYLMCKEKGIRLIQIPESEWFSNKDYFIKLIKCYIENGDFTEFLEGNRFNLMYLSETLFSNYEITEPSISKSGLYEYYNCGYGIIRTPINLPVK